MSHLDPGSRMGQALFLLTLRPGSPPTQVRVALQLEDGSRLQDAFCSGQTLWELLCHFAQTR